MASAILLLNTFYFLKSWQAGCLSLCTVQGPSSVALKSLQDKRGSYKAREWVFGFEDFVNGFPGSSRITSSVCPLMGNRVKACSEWGKMVLFPKPYNPCSPGAVLNWVVWKLLWEREEITTGCGQSSVEIIFWWQLGFHVILTGTKIWKEIVWYLCMTHLSPSVSPFREKKKLMASLRAN